MGVFAITSRLRPPVWLIGLGILPYGFFGAIALVTIPQLLAAAHVSETVIASITSFAMIPSFGVFLIAPILDVRFSRRSYAVVLALATALFTFLGLMNIGHPERLAGLLFAGFVAGCMYCAAFGGWAGSIVPEKQSSVLGAWTTIGNVAGFGVGAQIGISIWNALPGAIGAALIALVVLTPLIILLFMPRPSDERKLAHESFGSLFRDIGALIRRPVVLRTLFLFVVPAGAFALTNTLGGLGHEFGASERYVATASGIGAAIAGVIGSLMVPVIVDRMSPRLFYVAIGIVGAVFTAVMIVLPRIPSVYGVAVIGENTFQAVAFAIEATIIFRTIGEGNPLASTQYALLNAAPALPIVYMQAVDGQAYGAGNLSGMLGVDAAVTLAASLLLLPLVLRWRRIERAPDPA